jgi:hypothetical protein
MKFEKTLNMEFENKRSFSKNCKSRRDVMFIAKQITIGKVPLGRNGYNTGHQK